ncbi:F-box protein [Sporobolomyces salmoneus]|uniref:F-box protein n=1 Tax=Sporobolomyces salmoneus TaxID=183962 RepID=UPI0031797E9A
MELETPAPPKLLQLPPEVLLHTLAYTTPKDCAQLTAVNRLFSVLCSTWTLYRDLLSSLAALSTFGSSNCSEYPYQLLCQRFVQARDVLEKLEGGGPPPIGSDLVAFLETLVHLASTRPPANLPSLNEAFLEKYLPSTSSMIFSLHPLFSACSRQQRMLLRSKIDKPTEQDIRIAELVSQLHSLSAPTLVSAPSASNIRTAAREIVYERMHFTKLSTYGPLRSDGSGLIDYRKVEAIQLVMHANLEEAKSMGWGQEMVPGPDGGETNIPSGWNSTRTGSATTSEIGDDGKKIDSRNWAGITTHEWRGTYAFLHFPIYHAFNHHRTASYVPSLAEESEAVGDCMSLKLELLPEGVEVTPPMEAFRTDPDPNRARGRMARGGGGSDSDEDSDFDVDALEDEEDTSASSSEDDDGDFNTHFVTNRRETPSTSPPNDDTAVPPIGPLPPPSTSASSSIESAVPNSDSTSFPKLSFQGTSMPLQLRTLAFTGTFVNSQSHFNIRDRSVRGTVEMNQAGEVIWKYIIRYGGIDHWAIVSSLRRTGVQVGGPKSKFGVVGTWTCADRDAADDEGPNGPFW